MSKFLSLFIEAIITDNLSRLWLPVCCSSSLFQVLMTS